MATVVSQFLCSAFRLPRGLTVCTFDTWDVDRFCRRMVSYRVTSVCFQAKPACNVEQTKKTLVKPTACCFDVLNRLTLKR